MQQMMPKLHLYHLDDNPELRSCNLVFKSLPNIAAPAASAPITDPERLKNFYGRSANPRARYVREKIRPDYGKASDEEYFLELLEEQR